MISQTQFASSYNLVNLFWGISVIGIIIILFIAKKREQNKSKLNSIISYNKTENTFTYKQNPIVLEKDLHILFVFLINNQSSFILLDKINELFTNKEIHESYITINKRRDIAVNKLIFSLKTVLNKKKWEIIVERKNVKDKRVKEIKLRILVNIIE